MDGWMDGLMDGWTLIPKVSSELNNIMLMEERTKVTEIKIQKKNKQTC